MRIELDNMIKWLSKGTNLFRKIYIFVRFFTIYNIFAIKGPATLRIEHNSFRGDQKLQ